MKKIIITADDLGLSEKINDGIFLSHSEGIVSCASLLINAPATEHAIVHLKNHPKLQIGLHLGIVESYSSSNENDIHSKNRYFSETSNHLPIDWREFIYSQILMGKLDKKKWEAEFENQIQKFLDVFPSIPFLNSTQHLHLLPQFYPIVLKLAEKYKIPHIRSAAKMIYSKPVSQKMIQTTGMKLFSLFTSKYNSADYIAGVDQAGSIDEYSLIKLIEKSQIGTTEIILHPGHDDLELKRKLSRTYSRFHHEIELRSALSLRVREFIKSEKIELAQFPII